MTNCFRLRFAHASLAMVATAFTVASAPAQAGFLSDAIGKILTLPNYGPIPNLLDNQPVATDTCDVRNRAHTESATGDRIGVRQYGCVLNNRNVVFTVSIPKACETLHCGLIVDQHGATMNAEQQNKGTQLREWGWKAVGLGAPTPYIVVQPNMTDLLDNQTGQLDLKSVTGLPYTNELPALLTFVHNIVHALQVDPRRVHFHGFSRGGFTVDKVYCDPATRDLFASYVGSGAFLSCAVSRPFMQFIGLTDPNVALADAVAATFHRAGAQAQVLHESPNWTTPSLQFIGLKPVLTGKYQHVRYTLGEHKLEVLRHSGAAIPLAGHCLPRQGPADWLVCPADFDMGRKVVEFFIQNPVAPATP